MLDPLLGGGLYGLRIVTEPTLSKRVQVKFPKSKKRRMRKKWAKDQKNWKTVPLDTIYQMGNTLIMHPAMAERFRKVVQCQDQQRTSLRSFQSPGLFH